MNIIVQTERGCVFTRPTKYIKTYPLSLGIPTGFLTIVLVNACSNKKVIFNFAIIRNEINVYLFSKEDDPNKLSP